MKYTLILRNSAAAVLLAVLFSCSGSGTKNNADTTDSMADTSMVMEAMTADTSTYTLAHADLSGTKADTTVSGTAHFESKSGAVTLTLTLDIPKKAGSSVAVHLHEMGDCGEMGQGAHGHWNPTNESHGKWGTGAYHSGDIGNIKLDKAGKASLTITTTRWTIGGTLPTNILNRSVIVHAGVDDYSTQPSGNSGSRIGCGVIEHM